MGIILSLMLFLCLVGVDSSVHFKISSFGYDQTNILYQGVAVASVGEVELVNLNPSSVGRAMYADTVQIWDAESGKLTDFTSHFTFVIDTLSRNYYGSGFAFFLAPVGFLIPPNSSGGFASGLLYLQEECEKCVVHRDIKSSNIMLDSNFNLKLGDFGLARLMDNELGLKTTVVAGTYGYFAPEYASTGKASKESDIYSFGVVILEIVTGRRSSDTPDDANPEWGLVEWAWNLYGSAKILSAVDGRLNLVFDARQVECLMIVGLWCAHPDWNLRPSIRQAIRVLNFELVLPSLPTKMPVPVYHAPLSISEASSCEASMT